MSSYKKELIHTFQALPRADGMKNNRLVVVTAAGIFLGTPVLEDNKDDNDAMQLMYSFAEGVAEDYRKENNIPDDQFLEGNDGCIILSDVTLLTGGTSSHIPIIAIFFDQVIGISWGNIN